METKSSSHSPTQTKSGQGVTCPHCGSPIAVATDADNPFGHLPIKSVIFDLIKSRPGFYGAKSLERKVYDPAFLKSHYEGSQYAARYANHEHRTASVITAHIRQMRRLLRPLGMDIQSRRGWQGAQYRLVQL